MHRLHRTSRVAILCLVCACGPKPQVHLTGTTTPAQVFKFRNFAELVVESPAPYDFREFNVRDGTAFRVPNSELRVTLPHGEVLVTDQGSSNNQLQVGGVSHTGARLVLRADGSVQAIPGGTGGLLPAAK